MEQYINKSAIIAEIERLQDAIKATAIDDRISKEQAEAYKVCVKLRSFVEDTLEVKGVDLKKEIADQYEFNYEDYLTYEEFADIAKYFFELGFKSKQK